jgi:hypothetical protein
MASGLDVPFKLGLILGIALTLTPFALALVEPPAWHMVLLTPHAPWLVPLGIALVVSAIGRRVGSRLIQWIPAWCGLIVAVGVLFLAALAVAWLGDQPGEAQIRLYLEVGVVVAAIYLLFALARAPRGARGLHPSWLVSVGVIAILLTRWVALDQAAGVLSP